MRLYFFRRATAGGPREAWCRGRRTHSILGNESVSSSPAPLPPPCCAGWSSLPAIARRESGAQRKKRDEYEDQQNNDPRRIFDAGGVPGAVRCRESAGAAPLLHAVSLLAKLPVQAVPTGARLQGQSERVPETLGGRGAARPAVPGTAGPAASHAAPHRCTRARGPRIHAQ